MKTFKELMYELEERKVMSTANRRKLSLRMKKLAKSSVVQAKKARAKLKLAPDAKIAQRANKFAKSLVLKKYVDMDTYANMSLAQRQKIDDKVMKTKGATVKKIAKKLLPKLKKKELDRLRKAKENKGNE